MPVSAVSTTTNTSSHSIASVNSAEGEILMLELRVQLVNLSRSGQWYQSSLSKLALTFWFRIFLERRRRRHDEPNQNQHENSPKQDYSVRSILESFGQDVDEVIRGEHLYL